MGVRGANHEHSITTVERIHIPNPDIKRSTKKIHQIAIQYLTYLTLNKNKLTTNKLQ